MKNNYNNYNNNSNIFIKNLNKEHKLIPLNIIDNTLYRRRHFPSSTREWYDSIYAFNNNNLNNITILNKNLNTLIRGYFYMYLKQKKVLGFDNTKSTRLRRLSLKRIFNSKIELKHTFNKVVINMFVYNEEKRILYKKLQILRKFIFSDNISSLNNKYSSLPIFNKLHILNKKSNEVSFIDYIKIIRNNFLLRIKNEEKNILLNNNLIMKKKFYINIKKLLYTVETINNIISICEKDKNKYKMYNSIYNSFFNKIYLNKEIKLLSYYKLLLLINNNKFKDAFLNRLSTLISKIYNKEVYYNIINLKSAALNSDIFTEAIGIKLRRRSNRVLKTLKKFFKSFKVPKVNKWENKIIPILYLKKVNTSFFNKYNNKNEDLLNGLLSNIFLYCNNKNKIDNTLKGHVLNSINYKQVVGIRLEAKGRLTKRFTASRSLFKVKWKGSIRNIDSSYKGFSSAILRGHLKSNVQYSLINSTTRNGAFGIKGWMSGN